MSISITALAKVLYGKLVYDHPNALQKRLAMLEGKRVNVKVTLGKRSDAQNDFYAVCIRHVTSQLDGWTEEMVRDRNRKFCNCERKIHINKKTGEIIEEDIPRSSAVLSKDEFNEFLERCSVGWGEEGYEFFPPEATEYTTSINQGSENGEESQ